MLKIYKNNFIKEIDGIDENFNNSKYGLILTKYELKKMGILERLGIDESDLQNMELYKVYHDTISLMYLYEIIKYKRLLKISLFLKENFDIDEISKLKFISDGLDTQYIIDQFKGDYVYSLKRYTQEIILEKKPNDFYNIEKNIGKLNKYGINEIREIKEIIKNNDDLIVEILTKETFREILYYRTQEIHNNKNFIFITKKQYFIDLVPYPGGNVWSEIKENIIFFSEHEQKLVICLKTN